MSILALIGLHASNGLDLSQHMVLQGTYDWNLVFIPFSFREMKSPFLFFYREKEGTDGRTTVWEFELIPWAYKLTSLQLHAQELFRIVLSAKGLTSMETRCFAFQLPPFRVFTYETLIQKHKNTYWHSYWHWRQNSHTHRLRLKLILTFSNSHWHSVWHWAGQEDKTLKATSMSCHLILFYDQLFFPTAELRIHKFLLRVTFQ